MKNEMADRNPRGEDKMNTLSKMRSTVLQENKATTTTSSAESTTSSASSSLETPTHHLPNQNGFRNPWPSAVATQSNLTNFINNGIPLQLAKKLTTDIKPVRTLPADLKLYSSPSKLSDRLISTWLGHAGYLVQFPMLSSSTNQKRRPFRILFDPMFSIRAGPTQWTGPKRFKPMMLVLWAASYDHLDYDTIQELSQRQPHLKYFVPLEIDQQRQILDPSRKDSLAMNYGDLMYEPVDCLGLKAWFECVSVPSDQVIELDWWQSQEWDPAPIRNSQQATPMMDRKSSNTYEDDRSTIRISCVPAQHSSGRSLLDQNTSLWCGWIVEQIRPDSLPPDIIHASSSTKLGSSSLSPSTPITNTVTSSSEDNRDRRKCCVYFAGDTGYRSQHDRDLICPAFKEIGERFGPIDFSMIPIWRGGSLSFVSWAGLRISDPNFLVVHHASPEDAIRMHMDVQSKHTIGIHHSCFIGSDLESVEALVELDRVKDLYKIPNFDQIFGFGVVDVERQSRHNVS
ncbi:hypothetical protein PSTT_11215 [Puccinia striiformis]|uniref:Uncharacterized protein n=1 Tax=Puccinia striiformis TaxID=27350 RepID=A0A2S4V185_9BASI|nr:hypothetical protein PSTT_11215 [Puccinia striiformis]